MMDLHLMQSPPNSFQLASSELITEFLIYCCEAVKVCLGTGQNQWLSYFTLPYTVCRCILGAMIPVQLVWVRQSSSSLHHNSLFMCYHVEWIQIFNFVLTERRSNTSNTPLVISEAFQVAITCSLKRRHGVFQIAPSYSQY